MSNFNMNGKHFETFVEKDENNFDVVVLVVDGKKVDEEYVTLGSATHDMSNIKEVEDAMLQRNGYTDEDGDCADVVVCPACGAVHKRDSEDGKGWWQYVTGKWACDCGAEGKIWYWKEGKVSELEEVGE